MTISTIAEIKTENQAFELLNKAKRNEFIVFVNNDNKTFTKEKIIENTPNIELRKIFSKKLQKDFALLNLKFDHSYTIKEFVKELQNHRRIQNHENIINFYGIFEDSTQENIYSLILDYTTESLHGYLSANDLSWAQKLKLAKELASALYCLHLNDIVHGDLTSKSINILNGSIRLHSFGSFKRLNQSSQQYFSHYFNSIQYLDPQSLMNPMKTRSLKEQKKADIYSLGVLFWEISSRKIPFEKEYNKEPCKLCYKIVYENVREESVKDTPEFYENLYKRCWEFELEKRPNIEQILECLKSNLPISC